MKQENPNFSHHLIELAEEISTYRAALNLFIKDIDIHDLSTFKQLSLDLQIICLQEELEKIPDLQLTKEQFKQLHHILLHKSNYYHYLKNGYYLKKDYHHFSITKIGPGKDRNSQEIMLVCNESIETESFQIHFGGYLADADLVIQVKKDSPIYIRSRQPGDRIRLNGHHKKIRRLFIDQKISKEMRDKYPIILQDEQILSVGNLVSSDLSKSSKNDIIYAKLYIKMKE